MLIASLLSLALMAVAAVPTKQYNYLRQSCINHDCTAVRITLANPPINLFDAKLIPEFHSYLTSLQTEASTNVIVFSSDNADFFGDHLDLNLLSSHPPTGVNATELSNLYFASLDLISSTPVIFISEINGRAFGAGDEVALRTDMRFVGPNAILGAPEAAGGLLHVGGLQQLVRLIGPALALEYLLSSAEVYATEAARVGWVNRAFNSAGALRTHVDTLATRLALFHPKVICAHKAAVAESAPMAQALQDDMQRFRDLATQSYFQGDLQRILKASKNESRKFELNVNDNIVRTLYG